MSRFAEDWNRYVASLTEEQKEALRRWGQAMLNYPRQMPNVRDVQALHNLPTAKEPK